MYLIDKDILIYSLKGYERVNENLRLHIHDAIQISAVTLMELYYGAYKSQKVESNQAKAKKIENGLAVISVDRESVEVFGLLKSGLEKSGQPLDDFDLILAG